jgi:tetratricopeptide (TPR) repeat protein
LITIFAPLFECVLGADHPDTLRSRNNLAMGYRAAGRTAKAIPLYERMLADCERVLGADHPDTLTTRSNLAMGYRAAGRTAKAIPLLERTLADCERVLGADHPDTKAAREGLTALTGEPKGTGTYRRTSADTLAQEADHALNARS